MEQKRKQHYHDVNSVLERIIRQNSQIVPSMIELFSEVYYPIAILEIEMQEVTFEDFELVPQTVLKFVKAGLKSPDDIACIMGLSSNYVQKIMDLLMGYSYLNENGITDLGVESLKVGKKIRNTSVKQRFYADALTGDLLKLGEIPADEDIQNRKEIFGVIPIVPHLEGITVDSINDELLNSDITNYKKYKGEILHANVDEVKNVICVGLEYVRAYLLKMQGIDTPFIMTYSCEFKNGAKTGRFRWRPLRVPSQDAYLEYGFSLDIQCYPEKALTTINELYRLMCEKIEGLDEKKLKKLMGHIQPFDFSTMDIQMGKVLQGVPEQICIYVNSNSFTKWNMFVLAFLEHFDINNGYLYTNSWLNGLFIRFESQSRDIITAAKCYQRFLNNENRRDVIAYLRNELFNEKSEITAINFNELIEAIDKYETESTETMETEHNKEA